MFRELVERSLTLPVTVIGSDLDAAQVPAGPILRWVAWPTEERMAELEYRLEHVGISDWLCVLTFELLNGTTPSPVHQRIALTRSRPNFGGLRWWFLCPGNGQPCGRRCYKLYLPAGGEGFACRRCHGLVYSSTLA